MVAVQIRLAQPEDLVAINDIYNYYVEQSTCTFETEPVTMAERAEWFAEHDVAHAVTVADRDGQVVGWAALSGFHTRCAYRHTVESSTYVRYDLLGQGIGSALRADLIERARKAGHHSIIGLVCTESAASLALGEKFGFAEVAHLREVGLKFGRWLDVAYLQLML